MRVFIVMCLVAAAYADKLGYNYQPVSHSNSGLSFTPGSGSLGSLGGLGGGISSGSLGGSGLDISGGSIGGGSLGGGSIGGGSLLGGSIGGGSLLGGGIGGGSLGGGSIGGGSLLGGGIGGGSLLGGGIGGGSLGGGSIGGGSLGGGSIGGLGDLGSGISDNGAGPVEYNAAPAAELEKEFFTYSANEGDFDEPQAVEKVSSSLNKALRVIFIKGPENRGLENAALALAKQAAQQETAIYVLSKQADISQLANKLNTIRNNNNNKPEVHFVKYRTPEDAANAQRAIQSQYDQLGGKSVQADGGVAPVLNFASKEPARQINAQNPDNSYLPSSVFRRL